MRRLKRKIIDRDEAELDDVTWVPCCQCGARIELTMTSSLKRTDGTWQGVYCGDCGKKARKRGFKHG